MARRAYSSIHMNGNLLCAIDTETTGLKAGENDLIQVAVIPLGPDYEPSKQFPDFFSMKLKPKYMDMSDGAMKMNRELIADCLINGIDPWAGEERFGEWFESLRLPPGKKICPLGCNYGFDKLFLMDWLGGQLSYDYFFRGDIRDCQLLALAINDTCDFRSEPIPFPKVNLTYLAGCLGIPHPRAHDAVADALTSAMAYRRLLQFHMYYPKVVDTPNCDNCGAITIKTDTFYKCLNCGNVMEIK